MLQSLILDHGPHLVFIAKAMVSFQGSHVPLLVLLVLASFFSISINFRLCYYHTNRVGLMPNLWSLRKFDIRFPFYIQTNNIYLFLLTCRRKSVTLPVCMVQLLILLEESYGSNLAIFRMLTLVPGASSMILMWSCILLILKEEANLISD